MARKYEQTHSWLTFSFDIRNISFRSWMLLGAAQSKCLHIQGTPLDQKHAEKLHAVYLAKGAQATTAIEGNTLTEQEVLDILEKRSHIPQSKQYLVKEVENVIAAYNTIVDKEITQADTRLTVEEICRYNAMVLHDIEVADYVAPGRLRECSVVVMNYVGAPAEDCQYLLQRLCDTLNSTEFSLGDGFVQATGILKAILAHLYLVWIHPFGDGNGRTARLIEAKFCASAGIPKPACQLLSNFYNSTRTRYYAKLSESSKRSDFSIFLDYALQGLVDMLDEQIGIIRHYQIQSTWQNTVHTVVNGSTQAAERRRQIALALFEHLEGVPRTSVPVLSAHVAELFRSAGKYKTLTRDLNYLESAGLVILHGKVVSPNIAKILAWQPVSKVVA
ncbi:MAG: Fic family protein [Desulfovibrio sp.]|nr:Fic family protein [Desulfovibrio sp.]